VIKYTDDASMPQIMALDFGDSTRYAQLLIYKKMREKQPQLQQTPSKSTQDANKPAITSIADELSKLAKLKEQGIITEEEFSQIKNNLIKGPI
jgi:argininosuccinate lyase